MKILSGKTVYQHLINSNCGLLEFGVDVLQNGTFTIKENLNLSKNHTFRADFELHGKRQSLFLKQPKNDKKIYVESVKNEHNYFKLAKFKEINDDLLDFDTENNILLTKTDPNFLGLTTDVYKTIKGYTQFAKSSSKILFDFHEKFKGDIHSQYYLPTYKPDLLQTDKRWKMLEEMWLFEDYKVRQIAQKIEKSELDFESISKLWNDSETVIHRDLKYSNFLINKANNQEFKLVDYEFASIGDRCWDVSEFIFHLLKKKSSTKNVEEDPQWIRRNLYDFSNILVFNYANLLQIDKELFYKKVLSFFLFRLIQSYVSSIFNNLWDEEKKDMEYNNIIYFWNIVDNYFNTPSIDYYTNYIKKIK